MKVIVRGVTLEEKKYQLTCSVCRSVVEMLESEGKPNSSYQGSYFEWTCPVCERVINSEIKAVRSAVDQKTVDAYYNK